LPGFEGRFAEVGPITSQPSPPSQDPELAAMYGTVALCRVRPENLSALKAMAAAEDALGIDGYLGTDLLVVDNHPNAVLLVVRFKDPATYRANADSPAQDARYQDFRALMEDDPVWYDGDWVTFA
jgi:hypothetical protein